MGVIHRDLKPDNLFICEDQGHPYVKVLDFGIAKDLQDDGQITAVSENAMIGTPRYMAPEQITNKEISAQTDLYALAILTYERIVGVHPFETEECKQSNPMQGMPTSVQMSWNHLNATPQKLKGLGMLGELLMHALEKDPRARPKSAHLVCDKIKKWLSLNQSLAQERLPLGQALFNDATPIPSSDSIDRLPRVTPTPSLNQSGARPKRSDSLNTGERSKRNDSLDTSERSTPTADSTRERTRTARRSKKSVAAPAAKPAQASPLLRYIKWAARVILAIYLSAWLWYLSGSPHIPLLHDLIAPLFNAICHWGISVNDQLTR
jgi:serine/threonine protein kinase